jgi:predicted nucleic acid-binding protein
VTASQYLLDTSALVRLLRDGAVRRRWEQQITAGLIAICPVVELELLYTAKSLADRHRLMELLTAAFVWVSMPDRVFALAQEIQGELAQHGKHRSAGAIDLLIASTADLHGLALLHYDRDFDQIAMVTGQESVWLAPAGSVN